jgi:hypothetical protein
MEPPGAALLGKLATVTECCAGDMEGLLSCCRGGLCNCQAVHEIGNTTAAGQRDPATPGQHLAAGRTTLASASLEPERAIRRLPAQPGVALPEAAPVRPQPRCSHIRAWPGGQASRRYTEQGLPCLSHASRSRNTATSPPPLQARALSRWLRSPWARSRPAALHARQAPRRAGQFASGKVRLRLMEALMPAPTKCVPTKRIRTVAARRLQQARRRSRREEQLLMRGQVRAQIWPRRQALAAVQVPMPSRPPALEVPPPERVSPVAWRVVDWPVRECQSLARAAGNRVLKLATIKTTIATDVWMRTCPTCPADHRRRACATWVRRPAVVDDGGTASAPWSRAKKSAIRTGWTRTVTACRMKAARARPGRCSRAERVPASARRGCRPAQLTGRGEATAPDRVSRRKRSATASTITATA